jgi:hypothetical protein
MFNKKSKITKILASYPRIRPPLTAAHEQLYIQEYRNNREGERKVDGLAQKLEAWMHRQINKHESCNLLELGAGTLNHIRYENLNTVYDIVEPFTELYQKSPRLDQVRGIYSTLQEVPEDKKYSRIISIATLEHMTNLPLDVALSASHMENNSIFQAGIPSEGGFLWWLGWRCTTGISYWLRNRLDYGVLMRHEHVNKAYEIIAIVEYFFENVKIKRFPLPFHFLSFYTYIEARKPRMDRIKQLTDPEKV